MDPYELFLPSNGEITDVELEQITQSLVSFGDSVWLPANYSMSPLIDESHRHKLDHKLQEMIEAGLIRLWTLEGIPPRTARKPDIIIPVEQQRGLRDQVDTVAFSSPSGNEKNEHSESGVDTASKLIEFRHELWNIGIATQCDARGIVYGRNPQIKGQVVYGSNYENLSKKYTRMLFDEFQIPSLLPLTCKDIIDLRKQVAYLRTHLSKMVSSSPGSEQDENKIIEDCRSRYREYLQLVDEALKSKANIINEHMLWDIAHFVIPIPGFSALPIGDRLVDWFVQKDLYRFAFYMHSIKRIATERAHVGRVME